MLPFFLQPLLLARVFGPLEQAVVILVVVGLAMRTPAGVVPSQPVPIPVSFNINANGSSHQSRSGAELNAREAEPHAIKQEPQSSLLTSMNPLYVCAILLVLNLLALLISEALKTRAWACCRSLRPPYRDMIVPKVDFEATASVPQKPAISNDKAPHLQEISDSKLSRADQTLSSTQSTARSTDALMPASSRSTTSASALDAKNAAATGSVAVPNPSGKGKARMDGERPAVNEVTKTKFAAAGSDQHREPSSAASHTNTLRTKSSPDAQMAARRAVKSEAPISNSQSTPSPLTPPKVKSSNEARSRDLAETENRQKASADPSSTRTDDPLMAGDYKPLKSALKKTNKKPRQQKDIQHNYFLTMRGYRPALIPFPPGFHPKPHHARNSLWWDNVPRHAERIMAPPVVAKQPAAVDDEDEQKATVGKIPEGAKDLASVRGPRDTATHDRHKDKDSGAPRAKSSGERAPVKGKPSPGGEARDKPKNLDHTKVRDRAEMEGNLSRSNKPVSSRDISNKPASNLAVDRSVQKATLMAQGLLCCVLYYAHQQLGLLLLTFFVWQYITVYGDPGVLDTVGPPKDPGAQKIPITGSSKSLTSKTPIEAAQGKTSSDGRITPRERSTTALKDRSGELDMLIRRLRASPQLDQRMRDKLQKAIKERDVLRLRSLKENDSLGDVEQASSPPDAKARTARLSSEQGVLPSATELQKQAKEMDDVVHKLRQAEQMTPEHETRLAKAEERRRDLWKQVRHLNSMSSGVGSA
ncbi:hypothetical protein IAU60_001065 [Kwoniella sp. DSM 27419]